MEGEALWLWQKRATVQSSEAELTLLPADHRARPEGRAGQVDSMTAKGHVVITSEGVAEPARSSSIAVRAASMC